MDANSIKKLFDLDISPERKTTVMQDIFDGSVPAPRFYVMVIISNLIAVFGLIANSPAVIIGAMLVAPLMTPIFGISLALIRGNSHLLFRAMMAEVQGVALAVLLSFLVGLMPLAIDPTTEMLARTQPNLLDLLVAIFAGLAGAYAIVDERISPSLPGVAIATAIVPPLANTGLCLALGEYWGGLGSFLLFLANFLSILLAASLVFAAAGMVPFFHKASSKDLTKRFGVAIVSFTVIAVFFTMSLVRVVQRRHEKNTIERTLISEFSNIPGTYLRDFVMQSKKDGLHVLATVNTPTMISPDTVGKIETVLDGELGRTVDLIVRNSIVKDIGATGSYTPVAAQTLDGEVSGEKVSAVEKRISLAEQVFWEQCGRKPGFQVVNIEHHESDNRNFLMATIQTLSPLSAQEIGTLETEIRKRLQQDDLDIVVSSYIPQMQTSRGTMLYEWSRYEELTPQRHEKLDRIKSRMFDVFRAREDVFLTSIHFRLEGAIWQILLEVGGIRLVTQNEIRHLTQVATQAAGRPVEVFIWFKNEAVISETDYQSYNDFVKESLEKNKAAVEKVPQTPKEPIKNDPNQPPEEN